MHLHILIAAITFEQGASRFLEFLQIVSVLFGFALIAQGIWRISRSELSEAMAPIAGGFLLCLSVVIVRMFAGWVGVSL